MFKFSIRDVLWATLVVGLLLGWSDNYCYMQESLRDDQGKMTLLEDRIRSLEKDLDAVKASHSALISSRATSVLSK